MHTEQLTREGPEHTPETPSPDAGRKSIFAVVLGNAVEFFDFGVYATFAVMIGHTFFPSDSAFVPSESLVAASARFR